jgi:hypothetical protein
VTCGSFIWYYLRIHNDDDDDDDGGGGGDNVTVTILLLYGDLWPAHEKYEEKGYHNGARQDRELIYSRRDNDDTHIPIT